MSALEEQLEVQLRTAGILFEREFVFCPWRKFRADFLVWPPGWAGMAVGDRVAPHEDHNVSGALVEVQGFSPAGVHGSAFTQVHKDCEKQSLAAVRGYRVLTVTGKQIRNGSALAWIEAALGMRRPETLEAPRKPRRSKATTGRHKRNVITKTLDNPALTKLPDRVLAALRRKGAG